MTAALRAPALLLLCLIGCATPRYIGSIGRDRVYSNRGYGIALRLDAAPLLHHYRAVDPHKLEAVPAALRPQRIDGPLDLNGDGVLAITERAPHLEPALRLISKTTPDTTLDLSVELVGGERRERSLERLLEEALAGTAPAAVIERAMAQLQTRRHPGGFPTRVITLPHARWAVIEQAGFVAEERIPRRQLVWLRLTSPHLDDDRIADHEAALNALILSRRGGTPSSEETW